ncbi:MULTISPECIES: hypothetical protein [unclassified Myroides]|uniref:hypothetical protein n=1 Tax=unclassified Myroides TaxID=2642485 RepID=UPI003D2F990A
MTPTFQNGSLGFCYLGDNWLWVMRNGLRIVKVVNCVLQKKHPTTVTPLKKASTLINDNGRSVSKGKVQPKMTKKQQ